MSYALGQTAFLTPQQANRAMGWSKSKVKAYWDARAKACAQMADEGECLAQVARHVPVTIAGLGSVGRQEALSRVDVVLFQVRDALSGRPFPAWGSSTPWPGVFAKRIRDEAERLRSRASSLPEGATVPADVESDISKLESAWTNGPFIRTNNPLAWGVAVGSVGLLGYGAWWLIWGRRRRG